MATQEDADDREGAILGTAAAVLVEAVVFAMVVSSFVKMSRFETIVTGIVFVPFDLLVARIVVEVKEAVERAYCEVFEQPRTPPSFQNRMICMAAWPVLIVYSVVTLVATIMGFLLKTFSK